MEYRQVGDFRLSWKLTIILNLVAGAVFALGFFLFFWLYANYSDDIYLVRLMDNSNIWITYALVFAQVILHEYSHGIGYRLSGGKVTYGVKWLCPYCREVSGLYYPTGNFVLTLIMPLLTGTIIAMLVILFYPQFLYYMVVCMLTNISGAAGDIMMLMYVLLKANKGEFIKDEVYGFSVHKREIA